MKNILFLLLISWFLITKVNAQIFYNPIAGKQSHPDLQIEQIEITDINTIITLKVTNKRDQGGWFCADEHIYLKNSKGTEVYKLVRSENIPTCPEQFKFTTVGQELIFKLYFPPISDQIQFLDLVEDCSNACFSFHGIILDNEHNEKIRAFEQGFELYQEKQYLQAIPKFERVVNGKIIIDSHIYGLSYYYLILIYRDLGNTDKINEWYEKLLNSNLEEKATFIQELEKFGIKKKSSSKN